MFIKEFIVEVAIKKKDGSIISSRKYREKIALPPLTTNEFTIIAPEDYHKDEFSWDIVEVSGYPTNNNDPLGIR